MKQNKTLEEIKKEFEERFLDDGEILIREDGTVPELWPWIESTISQTKQELIEEIKEWSEYRRKNITGASVIESGKVLDKGSLFYNGYNQTIDELEEFLQKLSNK